VKTGRYRYSKWRWRILVHALDSVGTVAMGIWRAFRPIRDVRDPRRILIVQLDHLGDSVLTSPLIQRLRTAYPEASIDVLASPSNHEVFEADPAIRRVWIAERTWFERHPGRWSLFRAVWQLGRLVRGEGYDLGIDVRGDVLSVLLLTIARIPRRVGWVMGGGAFLLTDVAGVLDKDKKLIERLTTEQARALIKEGTISGGMIPKIEGCIEVVEAGVEAVVIIDGRVPHCVLLELFTEHGVGTMVARPDRKRGA